MHNHVMSPDPQQQQQQQQQQQLRQQLQRTSNSPTISDRNMTLRDSDEDDTGMMTVPAPKRRKLDIPTNTDDMIPPEVLHRLKEFTLFQNAPETFFVELSKTLRLVQYRPQEYIVKVGEPAKSMYWIFRGTVGVTSADGESVYAELAAGSFFGEIGILFNRPRTATVVARTKVLLGVLTKNALTKVLQNYPHIEKILLDEAQERLSMQDKRNKLTKMSLPAISRKVSIMPPPIPSSFSQQQQITHGDEEPLITSSLVANLHDMVPGPSLPPISHHPFADFNTLPSAGRQGCIEPSVPNQTFFKKDIFERRDDRVLAAPTSEQTLTKETVMDIDQSLPTPTPSALSISDHHESIPLLTSTSSQRTLLQPTLGVHHNFDNIDNTISIREFLSHLHIFASLPNEIMHELALDVEVLHFRPMDIIFQQGERGRDIYFIVYGEVEVVNEVELLARLKPMMYFGEMAFLSALHEDGNGDSDTDTSADVGAQSRSATIRSVTDCEILMIKATTLDGICARYPTIKKEFKDTAAERIKENIDHLQGTARGTVDRSDLVRSCSPMTFTKYDDSSSTSELTPRVPEVEKSAQVLEKHHSMDDGSPSLHNVNDSTTTMFKSFSFSNNTVTPDSRSSSLPSEMFTMPPMNPIYGSIHNFSQLQRTNFQYTSMNMRRRLSEVNGNRRRSSILNVGPLPDSMILKIFQILDLKSLIKCTRVCSRWKQIIYLSQPLFNTLNLAPYCKEIDDSLLVKIAKIAGSRPHILNISNCHHITDEGFSSLIQVLSGRANLRKVYMKCNWNISAMAIMDLSISCRQLLELDVSNCRKVTDDVIISLIGYRDNTKFGCPCLRSLRLGYCKYLTDRTMQHIINDMNDRVELLDLTRCTTITDNGFLNLRNNYFSKLHTFVLKDCTFLSDRVVEMISIYMKELEDLNLTFCCMLTDVSLKLLGTSNSKLRRLDLSFCGAAVSDYSLSNLKGLANLEYLSIKGCVRVTREGVDMLLTEIQNLKELNLLQCPRVNVFRGVAVEPFNKIDKCNYSCLKIKPHGRIVKVFV
jgi:F-box/leucine-rich repeat protein 7